MTSQLTFSRYLLIIGALIGTILLQGCISVADPVVEEVEYNPDFSTVPEAFDTTGTERTDLDNGITYYTIREGNGFYQVVYRDLLSIYFTVRTAEGTIIGSSYADSMTTPRFVRVADLTTQGMISGILGMKVNEQRTIVVPPALGYAEVEETDPNYPYRNDTLIYDLEVASISQ